MPYNKDELLALSPEERISIAEELWSSVENELLPITSEEIAFAEERLKMHESKPTEGLSLNELKSFFEAKYGF